MEFLTVKETARLLRVSPITIRRYIASGRLEAVRVGRGIRVPRESIEEFVTPVSARGKPFTVDDPLWNIAGIGSSDEASDVAESDEYVADAILTSGSDEDDGNLVEIYSPSSPEGVEFVPEHLLGKPITEDDPIWDIVGMGCSDGPTDVASNKHKYLAEAILARKSME